MRDIKWVNGHSLDAVADPHDVVQVEVQRDVSGGFKVYVHVNGITILRIGKITDKPVVEIQ